MAEMNTGGEDHGKKKGGKVHAKKQSTRIDMTPMVDLAFLLLTFFILTATFNKPQILEVNMPVPPTSPTDKMQIPKEFTTTILVGEKSKIYYYDGEFVVGDASRLKKTDLSKEGMRKILIKKNQRVYDMIQEKKKELQEGTIVDSVYKQQVAEIKKNRANGGRIVIIKPLDDAAYADVVGVLDEMAITSVVTFAIADITPEEKDLLKTL